MQPIIILDHNVLIECDNVRYTFVQILLDTFQLFVMQSAFLLQINVRELSVT